jgi:glycosyltransferase involved in cell wall biosynthesis
MLWHVVTGEYPPECGGVGDYTATLAQALVAAGDTVHVWTVRAPGGAAPARHEGVVVHELPDRFAGRSRAALATAWRGTPGTVLLQYVPNALGSRGLNLRFCFWLRTIHRSGADVRVMFHEPYFYFSVARPWRIAVAIVQRAMAATLLQAASRVYLSTETWYRYLRAVGVLPPAQAIPIPSSIPDAALPAAIERFRRDIAPAGGAVVGHFGTFGEHVGDELAAVLPAIASRVSDVRFALIGAGSREFLERVRRDHPDLAARIWASGRLDPADVSALLRACDVMIQPYPDGVTTRRTSVMAGLKNAVATVSTAGALTEPIWSQANAVALPASGDHAAFGDAVAALLRDPGARASLASRGADTYRRHFSIDQTVAALRGAPGV